MPAKMRRLVRPVGWADSTALKAQPTPSKVIGHAKERKKKGMSERGRQVGP